MLILKMEEVFFSLRVFIGYKHNGKKQIPQFFFRSGMTHLIYSLKKLGKTFKLQKEFLKTEMNHGKIYADIWRDKKDESIDYVKKDVLCTAFSYARSSKSMDESTGFSMKDCLSLPGLGRKILNSLRTDEDEPIYTYNDKYMRWFSRQSMKGGRVCAFSQYYKSKIPDDILKIISEELDVKKNLWFYRSISE